MVITMEMGTLSMSHKSICFSAFSTSNFKVKISPWSKQILPVDRCHGNQMIEIII